MSFLDTLDCHSWTRCTVIPEWVNQESTLTLQLTMTFPASATNYNKVKMLAFARLVDCYLV